MRVAGAALIDEDDVAIGLRCGGRSRGPAAPSARRPGRPAGEEKERIGLRIRTQRRQQRRCSDRSAALAGLAVLEDPQRAAIRVDRTFVSGAGMETIESRWRLPLGAANGDCGENDEKRAASQSPILYKPPRERQKAQVRRQNTTARDCEGLLVFCFAFTFYLVPSAFAFSLPHALCGQRRSLRTNSARTRF